LEANIATQSKETVYLKRALESVYSRLHANAQEFELSQEVHRHPDGEMDVQPIPKHTIEGLAKKDEEIKHLQETVANLKAQLSNSQSLPLDTSTLEKQFKARVAPPPPPPVKPKRSVEHTSNTGVTHEPPTSYPLDGFTTPAETLQGYSSQEARDVPRFDLLSSILLGSRYCP